MKHYYAVLTFDVQAKVNSLFPCPSLKFAEAFRKNLEAMDKPKTSYLRHFVVVGDTPFEEVVLKEGDVL